MTTLMIKINGVYEYKGNEYQLIDIGRMKHNDKSWSGACLYRDIKGNWYVRDALDFASRFKFTGWEEW